MTPERSIILHADEIRELQRCGQATIRRDVKAPNITALDSNGKPCGKMLYDLSRAWVDHGFPTDENGALLPAHKWGTAPDSAFREHYLHVPFCHPEDGWADNPKHDTLERVGCPYPVGTRVAVKETWRVTGLEAWHLARVQYKADDAYGPIVSEPNVRPAGEWCPANRMPRDAVRFRPIVASVRVVRGERWKWEVTLKLEPTTPATGKGE